MSLLKLAFQLYAAATRPLSARDLAVSLPVEIANPRRLTTALARQGVIQFAYMQGRAHERFYTLVPGAAPPVDERIAACRTRNLRKVASRARVRKLRKVEK